MAGYDATFLSNFITEHGTTCSTRHNLLYTAQPALHGTTCSTRHDLLHTAQPAPHSMTCSTWYNLLHTAQPAPHGTTCSTRHNLLHGRWQDTTRLPLEFHNTTEHGTTCSTTAGYDTTFLSNFTTQQSMARPAPQQDMTTFLPDFRTGHHTTGFSTGCDISAGHNTTCPEHNSTWPKAN
ncbi:hypothetical protein BC936DRAFT_140127 [Jimgerdemannia flammicorona]|uniref:Uncharacterized protein n=1 Tax=Jimgerdemannia flammicorona TaxID=994334 RepID=A0A433AZY1_9FUNG|nr:hypothetical protein BC936DRAFT_140127 [Jimgerdemannia flammicorona]